MNELVFSEAAALELTHSFFLSLLKDPPPPVESYCLPETESCLQNNSDLGTGLSQKRKALGEMSRVKRSRVH